MATAPHSLFARIYDLFMVPQERFGLRRQRARLCSDAAGRVLEIAIGTGLNVPHYKEAGTVIGIDNNIAMLRRAIRRTWETKTSVDLLVADARSLPFPDDSFDSIVVGLSLCTIPEPAITLRELGRVATADARLRFLEHVRSGKPATARRQDRFAPLWERVSGGCRVNQDTVALINQSAWSIEEVWASDSGGLVQGTAILTGQAF